VTDRRQRSVLSPISISRSGYREKRVGAFWRGGGQHQRLASWRRRRNQKSGSSIVLAGCSSTQIAHRRQKARSTFACPRFKSAAAGGTETISASLRAWRGETSLKRRFCRAALLSSITARRWRRQLRRSQLTPHQAGHSRPLPVGGICLSFICASHTRQRSRALLTSLCGAADKWHARSAISAAAARRGTSAAHLAL